MSSSNVPENATTTHESHVRQLVELTHREMRASSDQELDECLSGTRQIIDALVQEGNEAALCEAIDRAGALMGLDGALALRMNIEVLTTECAVETSGESVLRGGLYALPVQVFSRESGEYVGGAVSSDVFNGLIDVFRRQGLVRREATIGFVPYLYQEAEVAALEFSDIHALTSAVSACVTGKGSWNAGALMQSADAQRKESPAMYAEPFKLMYLVFGVVDIEEHLPFVSVVDGVVDEEQTDAALAACVVEVAPFIKALFGGERVLVHTGYPRPFCAALREGAENFRASHFHVLVLDHLKITNAFAQELIAVVTAHGDAGHLTEFRISALDARTGKLVFGEVYPFFLWEDYEEVSEALELHLRHEGFSAVELVPRLHPDDRCSCCGTPVFLDRAQDDGHLAPVRHTVH